MASLYKKQRSPFWYMEWRDPKTGLPVNRSTKYRHDSVEQTRKAKQLAAQRTADEFEAPAAGGAGRDSWKWVDGWLRMAYSDSPKTLSRYRQAWFAFSTFLATRRVTAPRQLEREEAEPYVVWRMNPPKGAGVRKACKNTALLDLKVVSRIMREAVLRKMAPANPFLQLGFKKDPVKARADILPHEMRIITKALKKLADEEEMKISWAIAMTHGRRLAETSVPMSEVNLRNGTITFRNKGGEARTKLLHPDLVPMMRKFKKEGRERTFEMPQNFSKKWAKFFDRIGLPDITFHSTRVRVATQLMEKGVDQRIAMDFIDHSSVLIHKIYLRQRPSHHQAAVAALGSEPDGRRRKKKSH